MGGARPPSGGFFLPTTIVYGVRASDYDLVLVSGSGL